MVDMGLSPRVRGNPGLQKTPLRPFGSIPACAGEPRLLVMVVLLSWVYPRVCGGTVPLGAIRIPHPGLSPRVRGNPFKLLVRRQVFGSIPACAGEPSPSASANHTDGVYPRVCGGTCNQRREYRCE